MAEIHLLSLPRRQELRERKMKTKENIREIFNVEDWHEADSIVCDEAKGYKVISDDYESFHPLGEIRVTVIQRLKDNKYFHIRYFSDGGDNDFEDGCARFEEVLPVEKTITVYEWPKS